MIMGCHGIEKDAGYVGEDGEAPSQYRRYVFGLKDYQKPSIITAGFRKEPRSPRHTP